MSNYVRTNEEFVKELEAEIIAIDKLRLQEFTAWVREDLLVKLESSDDGLQEGTNSFESKYGFALIEAYWESKDPSGDVHRGKDSDYSEMIKQRKAMIRIVKDEYYLTLDGKIEEENAKSGVESE